MKKLILCALLVSGQSAYALLSPFAQSCKEIETILQNSKTAYLLGESDPIDQILQSGSGYLIVTAHKQLLIEVQYLKSNKIGPQQFKLKFHNPTKID